MRAFGFLATVVVLAIGMYIYSSQFRSVSAVGGANSPTGAAVITGVKNDLISIANAERGCLATEGKYATFDQLVSGHYLTVERQRPPYSYDVQTTSTGFQAVAQRTTPGSPARVWIDETMNVQSSEQ